MVEEVYEHTWMNHEIVFLLFLLAGVFCFIAIGALLHYRSNKIAIIVTVFMFVFIISGVLLSDYINFQSDHQIVWGSRNKKQQSTEVKIEEEITPTEQEEIVEESIEKESQ